MVQGRLLSEQPGMPTPVDAIDGKKYFPTFSEFPDRNHPAYTRPWGSVGPLFGEVPAAPSGTSTTAEGVPAPFRVPVLHCEIEGNRQHYVCYALDFPLSIIGASKLCRWKPLGIPIGRYVCAVVSLALAPLVAIAVGIAWLAGSSDNRDFQNAGSLAAGDEVIVKGRWVFDAAHQGWNEIHPVTLVQRTSELGPSRHFGELRRIWCEAIDRSPVSFVEYKPLPQSMTPQQQEVYDQQRRPENRWLLHPSVDGCEPSDEPSDDVHVA